MKKPAIEIKECFTCKKSLPEDELTTCIHCNQGSCDDCPYECDCSIAVKLGVGTPEQVARFGPEPGAPLAEDYELVELLKSWITITKPILKPVVGAVALFAVLLAVPAHAQTGTTTDRVTRCETDSNDVTTCTTAPNYAEELRRSEQDRARELEANQRFWERVDRAREQGEQRIKQEKK